MKDRVSPAALLFWAALLFMDGDGCFAALLAAMAVHELGHILAIRACGGRIKGINVEIFGLKLEYSGALSRVRQLLCHLAGPAAGAVYGIICLAAGGSSCMSGAFSLALSAFNLLPILPLDGGNAAAAINEEAAAGLSRGLSLLLMILSIYPAVTRRLVLPLCTAAWLGYFNFFSGARPAFRPHRR